MGQLEPVNLPRIIEDLEAFRWALRVLGGLEFDFRSPAPDDWPHVRDERHPEMEVPPEVRREKLFQEYFDEAWNVLNVSLRRLAILLNDGDIDILDCDSWTRDQLKMIWTLPSEFSGQPKPVLQLDTDQEWHLFAAVWEEPIALMLEGLGASVADRPIYEGNGHVRMGDNTFLFMAPGEISFLNYLVAKRAASYRDLEKKGGVTNPSRTLNDICDKYEGALKPYFRRPINKDKSGYSTTIVDGRHHGEPRP